MPCEWPREQAKFIRANRNATVSSERPYTLLNFWMHWRLQNGRKWSRVALDLGMATGKPLFLRDVQQSHTNTPNFPRVVGHLEIQCIATDTQEEEKEMLSTNHKVSFFVRFKMSTIKLCLEDKERDVKTPLSFLLEKFPRCLELLLNYHWSKLVPSKWPEKGVIFFLLSDPGIQEVCVKCPLNALKPFWVATRIYIGFFRITLEMRGLSAKCLWSALIGLSRSQGTPMAFLGCSF